MIKNYLIVAWRQLIRNRQFTLINLLGLSTGLACTLLIVLWVQDERSIDRFHQNNDQLYQVMENRSVNGGILTSGETAPQLAEALKTAMPEVQAAAVTTPETWFPRVVLSAGPVNTKAAGLFASRDYLDVFTYPLVKGYPSQVLANKEGIVISQALAQRLFKGAEQAMGQTISWQLGETRYNSQVTGILRNCPANSSIQFDFLLPFDQFNVIMKMGKELSTGGPFHTYLVLKEGVSPQAFSEKLGQFMMKHSQGQQREMFLRTYGDSYLYGQYENGKPTGGRISYVRLFSLIALFILLMACINFINLATAKTAGHLKEIGIRKTLGAGRASLILQYLMSSGLLVLAAMGIALLFVILLLPAFNHITGKALHPGWDTSFISSCAAIVIITTLLSGAYPAFYLSGFRPVAVLKKALPVLAPGSFGLRRSLVVFQFSVSVLLIVGVIVVYRQLKYLQTHAPGFDKEQVLYFDAEGRIPGSLDAFLDQVRLLPGVTSAAAMTGSVLGGPSAGNRVWINGKEEVVPFRPFLVNYEAIETLGIAMKEGRPFSPAYGLDTGRIIFNEAAIQLMGIQDPIGKIVEMDGVKKEIIGVARNFHFQSLHEAIKPLFFKFDRQNDMVMVKMQPGKDGEAIRALQHFCESYNPGYPFNYRFLDADYQAQYTSEQRVAALAQYFAILAILIACLGLYGLAAFTAEKKRKEIGIRKVLGATTAQLAMLLSKDFLRTVAIALIIALPLAWWLGNSWLAGFAWHIPLSGDIFLATGMAVMLLTVLTVSVQAIRASMVNPVKNLDAE
ncbi:ABC transporter permease [Paraflavitalea sp. CAU 1676]|uniref:ABC transporter permease n=1 Tax=Paraflavitalea sp. CAU 1676 TaxID=3032598 RepID=UPI0023DC24CC|nr:ABC transporter permease [Paraflavitalea sp. CAU 1676]MDF2192562.1 ABC transporter permease [Paraflavitalea sp. CAU 1676]